jgi:hypothetical protein
MPLGNFAESSQSKVKSQNKEDDEEDSMFVDENDEEDSYKMDLAVGGNEIKAGDISIPANAGKTAVTTNPSLGSGEEENNEKANPSDARPGSEKASEPSVRLEIPRVAPSITDEDFDEKETTLEKRRVPTPLLTTHPALHCSMRYLNGGPPVGTRCV